MYNFSFGLDFGTSKTAVTVAKTQINAPITDIPIDAKKSKRIPTCVLRVKDTDQVWVGHPAQEEIMLERDPVERGRLEFFSNFKPHIHQSSEARKIAQQFIRAIGQSEGLSQRLREHANDAVLAAGCPVSWTEDGVATLLRILGETGYQRAFAVPEPVGASLYFLAQGVLKARDLWRDIVVFDWGAGTFDMTLLRAGSLAFQSGNTWGSNLYGGRLFDDLFYQWLLEVAQQKGRRRDLERLAKRDIDRAFLHGLVSREIKESFSADYSAAIAGGRPNKAWRYRFPVTVGIDETKIDLGDFVVDRMDEFDSRMQSYRISDMARPWLEQARGEVRAIEQHFCEALLDGEPVDLKAWATTLVAEGMRRVGAGQNAIAVLTGGSCNWDWFKDIVRAHSSFASRAHDIHIDDEPELTIARGLARAYTVGVSSRQMAVQVSEARQRLLPELRTIHSEPLKDLSFRINAEMRHDAALQDRVRSIFTETYRDALSRPRPEKTQTVWQALLDWLKGLFGRVTEQDPNEQALRPQLERSVGEWLANNETKLQRRWVDQFAMAAHRRVMDLLMKENLYLEGLVEVAVEACGATGRTGLNDALNQLGSKVDFGPALISKMYREITTLVTIVLGNGAPVQTTEAAINQQAEEATRRFFDAMPDAIAKNIARVQSPEIWAQRVIDDLIRTLETLATFAQADAAARISQQSPN